MPFTQDELDACLRVLQCAADDPSLLAEHKRFKSLVVKAYRMGKRQAGKLRRAAEREADQALVSQTGVVRGETTSPTALPALPAPVAGPRVYCRPRLCYVCKQFFTEVHSFYHTMCPPCAAFNYGKRQQRADLRGRRALLTGGRIKIGYELGLRLLRDGAEVIVTTRFPNDARRRYEAEPDAGDWLPRLRFVGMDLRDVRSVERFADHLLETEPHLDILINNAAQTVRRPLAFYAHLLPGEVPALLEARSGESALALTDPWFPPARLDAHGQQVDLRPSNSWSQRLHEVETLELVEVHIVNAVAPFVLASRLKPAFLRSPFARRFVVNVSAMEGQFGRESKTTEHPHTNMAKAALNMLTRTSAADYAADGIYMTSVDTGWITDENPHPTAERIRADGFFAPLDSRDGAARVYDPVARGLNEPGEPFHGVFLKDYAPFPW